jgi:hypothetical protein
MVRTGSRKCSRIARSRSTAPVGVVVTSGTDRQQSQAPVVPLGVPGRGHDRGMVRPEPIHAHHDTVGERTSAGADPAHPASADPAARPLGTGRAPLRRPRRSPSARAPRADLACPAPAPKPSPTAWSAPQRRHRAPRPPGTDPAFLRVRHSPARGSARLLLHCLREGPVQTRAEDHGAPGGDHDEQLGRQCCCLLDGSFQGAVAVLGPVVSDDDALGHGASSPFARGRPGRGGGSRRSQRHRSTPRHTGSSAACVVPGPSPAQHHRPALRSAATRRQGRAEVATAAAPPSDSVAERPTSVVLVGRSGVSGHGRPPGRGQASGVRRQASGVRPGWRCR